MNYCTACGAKKVRPTWQFTGGQTVHGIVCPTCIDDGKREYARFDAWTGERIEDEREDKWMRDELKRKCKINFAEEEQHDDSEQV